MKQPAATQTNHTAAAVKRTKMAPNHDLFTFYVQPSSWHKSEIHRENDGVSPKTCFLVEKEGIQIYYVVINPSSRKFCWISQRYTGDAPDMDGIRSQIVIFQSQSDLRINKTQNFSCDSNQEQMKKMQLEISRPGLIKSINQFELI